MNEDISKLILNEILFYAEIYKTARIAGRKELWQEANQLMLQYLERFEDVQERGRYYARYVRERGAEE